MFGHPQPDRSVRCYHCGHALAVPASARSANCPACHKGLVIDDLTVKDASWSSRLTTCGRVFVQRKGRAVVRRVDAGEGIEVSGVLEGDVNSGGPVVVCKGATLRGADCRATSLWVDPGGIIDNVRMTIGPVQ